MIKLFDRFRAGQPSSAVPASWFNAVAGWLNHLRGEGVGCEVTVTKPDHPSEANPPVIRVRVNQAGGAQLSTQLPMADSENGSSGESDKAARGDHSHPHSAKLIEVYDWCIEAEGRIQTAEDNDVSIYDWIDTHVQEENALFEAVNTDLNTLFQNDQTLQNNLTAIDQNVANLYTWSGAVNTDINTLFQNDSAIIQRLDGIDVWCDWAEGRMMSLHASILTNTGNIETILSWGAGVDANLDAIFNWGASVDEQLDTLFAWANSVSLDSIAADINTLFQNDQTLQNNLTATNQNVANLYTWADSVSSWSDTVETDLNSLFQNDQTLYNNQTTTNQSVANLQDWANNMTTWAQNFDASLDQLFANDQTLYNNQNDLWAGLNSLNEWSNNVAAWSNNVNTDINTLFDAVNRIYYYWRGGYFG